MKTIISGAALMPFIFANHALAQSSVVITEQTPVQVVSAGQAATAPTVTSETIVIPTTATPMVQSVQPQPAYEVQPTTVIQASPLTQSRAEQLRQAREHAEIQTEQMIVEKLEQSRLEDERRRAQQLFGGALDVSQQTAPIAPQQQQQQVQPAPVEAPAAGASIEEVRAAVREELAEVNKVEEKKSRSYLTGGVGVIGYSYDNIENKIGLSLGWGMQMDDRWALEVGYNYSEASIDESYWFYRDLIQHGLSVSSKFSFLTGRIKPFAGLGLQYTHREYSDTLDQFNGQPVDSFGRVGSDAMDVAVMVGLDLQTADRMSIGLEYKYLNNLAYKYNDESWDTPSFRQGASPLEESSYDVWSVTLKYLF